MPLGSRSTPTELLVVGGFECSSLKWFAGIPLIWTISTRLILCLMFAVLLATGWRSRVWANDRIGSNGLGFRQFRALQLAAFYAPIGRMDLEMVLAARAAEKEQNELCVWSHIFPCYFDPITTYTASGLFEIVGGITPVLTVNPSPSKALARVSAGISRLVRPSSRKPIVIPEVAHSRAFKSPTVMINPVVLSCSAHSHFQPALISTPLTILIKVIDSGSGFTASTNGVPAKRLSVWARCCCCSDVSILAANRRASAMCSTATPIAIKIVNRREAFLYFS
jgi:hypothetical protein